MAEKRLASRFKAALSKEGSKEDRAAEAQAAEDARRVRFVEAEKRLFDDLAGLVAEIGGIDTVQAEGELVLSRGPRRLSLHRDHAVERLEVRFDGKTVGETIVPVDEAWHLESDARRLALFDAGLEELLVRGLGLPPPESAEEVTEPVAAAAPALAPTPSEEAPKEQVIIRGVKLEKPAAPTSKKDGPKEAVILRDVKAEPPSGDTKAGKKELGSPGSTVRDIRKW